LSLTFAVFWDRSKAALEYFFSPKATSAFLKWLEQTVCAAFERCRPEPSQRFVYEVDEFDVLQVIR
jgi:hypothetical protein